MMKENSNISSITIIGNTTWGQAIATLINKEKVDVKILCRTKSEAKNRVNKLDKLKSLPQTIQLSSDLSTINNSELIIFAFPSQSIISNLKIISNNLNKNHKILIASKGIEKTSGRRLSEVLTEEITLINKKNIAILSGPNLAKEIYENKTTSTVIASINLNLANNIKTIIESNKFKIYLTEDIIGVELGGALKNIVTLGAGICDGLNIGNNLKGAFISIAFSEIVKLALSAGAQSVTISGLSGLGDTLASSYSPFSRNRLAGQYFAEGYSINNINKKINNIIEGLDTLYGAKALSKKLNIDHTFIDLLIDVCNQNKHPKELLKNTIGNI